ncbi:MAG TPA: carbon monoxide dehydrogenase [Blastocatellia bacterium]|jgi:CO/xanthine dehydrogenase FAD-binding subunit|nr:carbon monoxide dehydrogenase [Blastocatellia bacterium]HAF24579.1 carbon monoxide dehydrogenase [Blastocatellia bacterium]HCX30868.1 carbon monoxide dehydrogenase [Blastocatellia bacterium]
MRAYVPSYQLISPAELSEALDLMAREPSVWQPFAGGTDLMVLLESGKLPHKNYLNIWNLAELRGIEVSAEHITLGALTTYTEVQANPILRKEFPMLCQAASETGGLAIQNRGTLGGNIANASPAADSPPALLAYDAEVELTSLNASRWMPYHGFHTGYKQMIMRADELLTRIRLRRTEARMIHYYRKVGTRKAQAISKVCFAATARIEDGIVGDLRIALGSVAPVPLRCIKTEAALRGKRVERSVIDKAKADFAGEIVPIDDIRSTRNYRIRVSLNLLEDFLRQLSSNLA